ncbi:MAG: 16S rRNA (guanine(966)-N(2))-methyltransferase RsmD [Oleiphilaceae bacterium]|nr:16S rRNA (guanine(966)-N(2))-methyltransferase RsmD [Oleiphilaceae bacterium]
MSVKKTAKKSRTEGGEGELRLIGGDWRSRKLRFPAVGGVRPTPARTRETLFNWLSHHLADARCLDLFAGSGALGLEALSRGAREVTLVDKTPALAKALIANLKTLNARCGRVVCCPVEDFLAQTPAAPYDIIFLDPPFRQGWAERLLPILAREGWVGEGSRVYMEHESELTALPYPDNWELHRKKTAGQVTYNLFRVLANS